MYLVCARKRKWTEKEGLMLPPPPPPQVAATDMSFVFSALLSAANA
jgi:hypothetical protein